MRLPDETPGSRRDAAAADVVRRFDLRIATVVFEWVFLTLDGHERAVRAADPAAGHGAVLDRAIVAAARSLRVEPSRELFVFLRWCVQRRRVEETDALARAYEAAERRRVTAALAERDRPSPDAAAPA